MEKRELTCIECPVGCRITVTLDGGKVTEVVGNSCPRGKMYAENEVVCPKRVLTTTVRHESGRMLSVKTDAPIKKENLLPAVKEASKISAVGKIKIGDVIVPDFCDGANLVATDNAE